jgi:hypothetical protein
LLTYFFVIAANSCHSDHQHDKKVVFHIPQRVFIKNILYICKSYLQMYTHLQNFCSLQDKIFIKM